MTMENEYILKHIRTLNITCKTVSDRLSFESEGAAILLMTLNDVINTCSHIYDVYMTSAPTNGGTL